MKIAIAGAGIAGAYLAKLLGQKEAEEYDIVVIATRFA